MLGLYLLFMALVIGLPWMSEFMHPVWAWLLILIAWMMYLFMFAERIIAKKYRYVLPWMVSLLFFSGVFMLIDSCPPHIGLWGRIFLSGIILFQALLIVGSEALLIMGATSSYLWFLFHNLIFIVGLSWFVLLSYFSWLLFSFLVIIAGIFLFLGLKRWRSRDVSAQFKVKNVIEPSVVLLILAGYFILLGFVTKLVIFLRLDLRVFFSALIGTFLAFVFIMILFWDRLRGRLSFLWKRFLREDSYDYAQEWDNFVSMMEDLMNEKEIIERLKLYLKQRFPIDDVRVMWRCRPGEFVNLANREVWNIDLELEKWLWYKDCPLSSDELMNNNWDLSIERGWIIVPMIFRKKLVGLLFLKALSDCKQYEDFFYMLARNLAILITLSKLSAELVEVKQFEHFNKMVSFVVHDLKNSLSALELLLKNWKVQKNNPVFIEDAFQTLESVVHKIRDLITRLKIYPGKLPGQVLNIKPVALKSLVQNSIKSLGDRIFDIAVIYNDVDEDLKVEVDPKLFLKVFRNLFMNSIEAVKNDKPVIKIWVEEEKDIYRIHIKDNGIGMSEEFIRNELFRPFVSTKKDGLGIGMYEVKSIITKHKGKIEVISSKGSGSEVIIELIKRYDGQR